LNNINNVKINKTKVIKQQVAKLSERCHYKNKNQKKGSVAKSTENKYLNSLLKL
jgi:hypothetical protein